MSLLLLLLLLAGACNDAPEDGTDRGRSPDSSSGPRAVIGTGLSTTAATTTTLARFEFVDYQRAGTGGVSWALKVYPDARAICFRNQERIEFRLPATTVTELRTALERADLAALPAVNGTPAPDVAGGRVIFGGQSVRYYGTSMPPALGPAVLILDGLIARGCP